MLNGYIYWIRRHFTVFKPDGYPFAHEINNRKLCNSVVTIVTSSLEEILSPFLLHLSFTYRFLGGETSHWKMS